MQLIEHRRLLTKCPFCCCCKSCLQVLQICCACCCLQTATCSCRYKNIPGWALLWHHFPDAEWYISESLPLARRQCMQAVCTDLQAVPCPHWFCCNSRQVPGPAEMPEGEAVTLRVWSQRLLYLLALHTCAA